MPPYMQRNQIEMQQEISHVYYYFITHHSESITCIYKEGITQYIPHEGMPQKHSHKCKPCRIICKCTGLSQVNIFKLCIKTTESFQIAMPYQST